MDEKTERLREIFLELTEEGTVTESQEQSRGSLTEQVDVDERLAELVAEMRERYELSTSLVDDQLVTVVKRVYDGESDTAIAENLGVSRRTVVRARLGLHLVRPEDCESPVDIDEIGRAHRDGASVAELADEHDVSESTIRRYLRVFEADRRSKEANRRYLDEFDALLADAELSTRMAREVHEDGLDEATEGLETNVSF